MCLHGLYTDKASSPANHIVGEKYMREVGYSASGEGKLKFYIEWTGKALVRSNV